MKIEDKKDCSRSFAEGVDSRNGKPGFRVPIDVLSEGGRHCEASDVRHES